MTLLSNVLNYMFGEKKGKTKKLKLNLISVESIGLGVAWISDCASLPLKFTFSPK